MLKQYLIHIYKTKSMPSKETIKRSLARTLEVLLAGAGVAFVATPLNIQEPKEYLVALGMATIVACIVGLKKLVSGYIKYDR